MGCGELPWTEKVLLGFAVVTLLSLRVVLATTVLVLYYLICRICTLFVVPNREEEDGQKDYAHVGGWRRSVLYWLGRVLSRVMLFVFGFYWIQESCRGLNQFGTVSFDKSMMYNGIDCQTWVCRIAVAMLGCRL
ncbi:putative plasmalogen synthase [Helianthus annuus]|uniref:Plasmalogen synthase n=1 Tax=Helianthus annuus TaxID=4232 RepID=A0A251RQW9_HELAN|nr:putative plasmalogen synthase [Helianthus annuus]KAJ0429455.1 putative plasmalogen synthase [Helianthus annuus]KAJ0636453.1 putative plasmalogen synthase [Helianthus annuus]